MANYKVSKGPIINDIPNEIISNIFSYLTEKASLLQVSLTNQRFNKIVERFRYRTIRLSLDSNLATNPTHRFDQLVSHLSTRPELKSYILSVEIIISPAPHDEVFKGHNALLDRLPSLHTLALHPPPPDLGLAKLVSLRTLELDFHMNFDYWPASTLERKQYPLDPMWQRQMDLLSQCFQLPLLALLIIRDLDISKIKYVPLLLASGSRTSNITNLCILRTSDSWIGALPQILRSIAKLEYFTLEVYCDWDGGPGWQRGIAPADLGEALSQHTDTLIELNIACSYAAAYLDSSLFGSLLAYRHLRRLAIPEPFFVSTATSTFDEVFPVSLEEIQLQYPMGLTQGYDTARPHRISRLDRLAENKQQLLPKLKTLLWWDQHAHRWRTTGYGFQRERERLYKVFEKTGVKFGIIDAASWHDTPFGGFSPE